MDSTVKMGEEKVPKLLLSYSLPVFVSYIAGSIYSIISKAFIGNSVAGVNGLAALSVSFPVTSILMSFAFLFGMGGSTMAAIKVGEGDRKGANRVMNLSFQMIVLFALAYTVVGNIFLDKILILFGASEEVLPYAIPYTRIVLCSGVFQMIGIGMTNYMRVEGKTFLAMVSVFIGPVINIALSFVFILWLKMALIGAALATALGQIGCAVVIVWHYLKKGGIFAFDKSMFKLEPKLGLEIMYLGLSSFAVNFTGSIVSVFLNRVAKNYGGDVAISGLGVVTTLQGFLVTPISAVNMGWQALLGFNFGARKFDRMRQIVRVGILSTTVIMCLEYIAMHIWPTEMVRFFSTDSPELIEFSKKALVTYLFMLPIIPLQTQGAGFLQAIRKPIHSVVLSLSRQLIILIPALLILPHFFGIDGVLYAGPLADLISVAVTLPFLLHFYRNLEKIRG